jgi:predicted nucleic acid-binding protein
VRKIYWDSMLLIYLLDGHPKYSKRVVELLQKSYSYQDQLFTSFVGLGEVMAGAAKAPKPTTAIQIREVIDEMGFSYLPFENDAVKPFSELRAVYRVKTADAIHLACAAAVGMDLFLTGDKELQKLYVPGVQFIADFENPII